MQLSGPKEAGVRAEFTTRAGGGVKLKSKA